MFSTSDTIVAIATPPGRGGIGVVRVSGTQACAIAQHLITRETALEPRRATYTRVRLQADSANALKTAPPTTMDDVIVTYFPGPRSYTGEDVVEISAHGSPVILRSIVATAIQAGARPAEPGEFTLRAYLNGRIDLMQAEAVSDLIDAVTPLQVRVAFDQLHGTLTRSIAEIDAALFDLIARLEASIDFPDEGYHFADPAVLGTSIEMLIDRTNELIANGRRGRLVREGLHVAIVGPPNVGKSSIFNLLAGASRAIVTDVPGTTRDLVTETVDIEGLRVTLIDTAGLRESSDVVEVEGVTRSRRAADVADLILSVADQSQPLVQPAFIGSASGGCQMADSKELNGQKRRGGTLLVANKSDLPAAWTRADAVEVSALTGDGFDRLRRQIVTALDVDLLDDRPEITNVRHISLVERARDALLQARSALTDTRTLPEEFVLSDLQDARAALEEITGRRTSEDVLTHIFARFCIGK